MEKTLEELRAETDQYVKNITELGEKIMYQIETIKTAIRGEYMTEEQLIKREQSCKFCSGKGWTLDKWAKCPQCGGVGITKDSTIL